MNTPVTIDGHNHPDAGLDATRPWGRVFVGVLTRVAPHPNADREVVVEVDAGWGRVTVVTGGPNKEDLMDAKLAAETETLRRTAMRLERAGLVIDRAVRSPTHRRACFALQFRLAADLAESERRPAPIGFPYPNAR